MEKSLEFELENWEMEQLTVDEVKQFSEVIFASCGIGCGGTIIDKN